MYKEMFIEGLECGLQKNSSMAASSVMRRIAGAGSRGALETKALGRMLNRGIGRNELNSLAEIAGAKGASDDVIKNLIINVGKRNDIQSLGKRKLLSGTMNAPAGLLAASTAGKTGAGLGALSGMGTGLGSGAILGAAPSVSSALGMAGLIGGGLAGAGVGTAAGLGVKRIVTNAARDHGARNILKRSISGKSSSPDKVLVNALKEEFGKINSPLGKLMGLAGK